MTRLLTIFWGWWYRNRTVTVIQRYRKGHRSAPIVLDGTYKGTFKLRPGGGRTPVYFHIEPYFPSWKY